MIRKPLFLLLTIFSIFTSFTHANSFPESSFAEKISLIVDNKYHCVNRFEESKIYINAENIIPTENGITIDLDGNQSILAPPICSDIAGCFIKISFSLFRFDTRISSKRLVVGLGYS